MTQGQLTQKLEVGQATMAKTLQRMSRDGLITRTPHPDDNRAAMIHLTERARQLEPSAKVAAKSVNARAFGALSRKEQKHFAGMAQRVITTLKEDPPES